MKKVWRMIFALTLALVLFAGCAAVPTEQIVAETDQYSVVAYGDSYALRMKNELSDGSADLGGTAIAPSEVFLYPSLSAMKTAVTEGKFTEKQLAYIQKSFAKNEKGDVQLFDMNKLCDVVLPQGAEVGEIQWVGKNYAFSFRTEDFSGCLIVCDEKSVETFSKQSDVAKMTEKIVKTEALPGQNATVYYIKSAVGVRKHTKYSYSGEYGTFSVCQCDPISDLGLMIRYWGEYNGVFFHGYIANAKEFPSYEWFQEFGLKPYVEANNP